MRTILTSLIILVLILILGSVWFFKKDRTNFADGKARVKVGSAEYSVDVATSPALKAKGLAGRSELSEDEGMLFPFSPPSRPAFWMKGMVFPIDIIWIFENEVVGVEKEVPILSGFGIPTYKPDMKVDYALEVAAGQVDKRGIEVGDKVVIR